MYAYILELHPKPSTDSGSTRWGVWARVQKMSPSPGIIRTPNSYRKTTARIFHSRTRGECYQRSCGGSDRILSYFYPSPSRPNAMRTSATWVFRFHGGPHRPTQGSRISYFEYLTRFNLANPSTRTPSKFRHYIPLNEFPFFFLMTVKPLLTCAPLAEGKQ